MTDKNNSNNPEAKQSENKQTLSNGDPIKVATANIISAAADNSHLREAGDNLAKAGVTLTEFINTMVLPIAAVNFGMKKAKEYFHDKFPQDLAEKTQAIPPEHTVPPKASVAGPTLQGLAFSHEEPDLKEMYLNLLATSMDSRTTSRAHPSFVEIIRQLDSEDAAFLQTTLSGSVIPVIRILLRRENGYLTLIRHLTNYTDTETGMPVENENIPVHIDNWVRLGLFEITYNRALSNANAYSWVEQRPEFLKLKQESQTDGAQVECHNGGMWRTDFGKQFALAVGIELEN